MRQLCRGNLLDLCRRHLRSGFDRLARLIVLIRAMRERTQHRRASVTQHAARHVAHLLAPEQKPEKPACDSAAGEPFAATGAIEPVLRELPDVAESTGGIAAEHLFK